MPLVFTQQIKDAIKFTVDFDNSSTSLFVEFPDVYFLIHLYSVTIM